MNGCALLGVPPAHHSLRDVPPPDYTVLHGLRAALEVVCEPTDHQLEISKFIGGPVINRYIWDCFYMSTVSFATQIKKQYLFSASLLYVLEHLDLSRAVLKHENLQCMLKNLLLKTQQNLYKIFTYIKISKALKQKVFRLFKYSVRL